MVGNFWLRKLVLTLGTCDGFVILEQWDNFGDVSVARFFVKPL